MTQYNGQPYHGISEEKKILGGILDLNDGRGQWFVGIFICLVLLCIIFSFVNKDLNVNIASIILAVIALVPFGFTLVNHMKNRKPKEKTEKKESKLFSGIRTRFSKISESYNKSMKEMSKWRKDQKDNFIEEVTSRFKYITDANTNIINTLKLMNLSADVKKKMIEKLIENEKQLAETTSKVQAAVDSNVIPANSKIVSLANEAVTSSNEAVNSAENASNQLNDTDSQYILDSVKYNNNTDMYYLNEKPNEKYFKIEENGVAKYTPLDQMHYNFLDSPNNPNQSTTAEPVTIYESPLAKQIREEGNKRIDKNNANRQKSEETSNKLFDTLADRHPKALANANRVTAYAKADSVDDSNSSTNTGFLPRPPDNGDDIDIGY
jgi:hypothetical protein